MIIHSLKDTLQPAWPLIQRQSEQSTLGIERGTVKRNTKGHINDIIHKGLCECLVSTGWLGQDWGGQVAHGGASHSRCFAGTLTVGIANGGCAISLHLQLYCETVDSGKVRMLNLTKVKKPLKTKLGSGWLGFGTPPVVSMKHYKRHQKIADVGSSAVGWAYRRMGLGGRNYVSTSRCFLEFSMLISRVKVMV